MKLTKSFKQTISGAFGKIGEDWLEKLPDILEILKEVWQLSEVSLISNMTYHFVAKVVLDTGRCAVLKVGCDRALMQQEVALLRRFKGQGAPRVIDFYEELNAFLLEQIVPGDSLKDIYPKKMDEVMESYADVVSLIHGEDIEDIGDFPEVSHWLGALDQVRLSSEGDQLLELAKKKRDDLLVTMEKPRLLHGDLHLDNILRGQDGWVCIDPKGVVGDKEFEVAAFDIFAVSEIKEASNEVFLRRIHKLADVTGCLVERLQDWFFVRLVLSAAWSTEDKGDPSVALKLASLLFEK